MRGLTEHQFTTTHALRIRNKSLDPWLVEISYISTGSFL